MPDNQMTESSGSEGNNRGSQPQDQQRRMVPVLDLKDPGALLRIIGEAASRGNPLAQEFNRYYNAMHGMQKQPFQNQPFQNWLRSQALAGYPVTSGYPGRADPNFLAFLNSSQALFGQYAMSLGPYAPTLPNYGFPRQTNQLPGFPGYAPNPNQQPQLVMARGDDGEMHVFAAWDMGRVGGDVERIAESVRYSLDQDKERGEEDPVVKQLREDLEEVVKGLKEYIMNRDPRNRDPAAEHLLRQALKAMRRIQGDGVDNKTIDDILDIVTEARYLESGKKGGDGDAGNEKMPDNEAYKVLEAAGPLGFFNRNGSIKAGDWTIILSGGEVCRIKKGGEEYKLGFDAYALRYDHGDGSVAVSDSGLVVQSGGEISRRRLLRRKPVEYFVELESRDAAVLDGEYFMRAGDFVAVIEPVNRPVDMKGTVYIDAGEEDAAMAVARAISGEDLDPVSMDPVSKSAGLYEFAASCGRIYVGLTEVGKGEYKVRVSVGRKPDWYSMKSSAGNPEDIARQEGGSDSGPEPGGGGPTDSAHGMTIYGPDGRPLQFI